MWCSTSVNPGNNSNHTFVVSQERKKGLNELPSHMGFSGELNYTGTAESAKRDGKHVARTKQCTLADAESRAVALADGRNRSWRREKSHKL